MLLKNSGIQSNQLGSEKKVMGVGLAFGEPHLVNCVYQNMDKIVYVLIKVSNKAVYQVP